MFMTGIEAFLEMLAEFGVRHIFGNPGSTELPLNDALVDDDRFQYILGLQEVPVMAMADGFAMASRQPGVVNLHICCGLGNAMGMLYNAFREGTPLLVTAGQQHRDMQFEEPILGGQMVRAVGPWTKWAVEVERVRDLPIALRRAVQTALTPPTGPVFMSLPVDLQIEPCDEFDLTPIRLPDARVRPPINALREAADVLAAAENPGILVGSRVLERDAVAPLVDVAERLGAPVYSEATTTHGRLAFPPGHRLYAQVLPHWSPQVREVLGEFDVLLVAGMDVLRQYIQHEPARAIPEHVKIVHLDEDPWQLGKNYAVEVGLIGDARAGLAELGDLLAATLTEEQRAAAAVRADARAEKHRAERQSLTGRIAAERDVRPMTAKTLMHSLARVLPDNVAVVEESVTTTNTMFERLGALKNTTGYFAHRGWALGWGLGCALGVKLAWPDRPVLGVLGEGASMYGIQGLWSAAHHDIPATFVVCNNAQYQILKFGAKIMQLPRAMEDRYLAMDLVDPQIDFVALAQSLGVEAHRVAEPDQLSDRVKESLAGDKPVLLDVPISPGDFG